MVATEVRNLSDRYRNIADFVDALFTNFPGLLAPGHHPKWREVNIAAAFPGWTRHPAARQWLKRNAPVAGDTSPESVQALFSRLIEERRQNSGGAPMPDAEKNALFRSSRPAEQVSLIDGIGQTRGRASRPRICNESKIHGSNGSIRPDLALGSG